MTDTTTLNDEKIAMTADSAVREDGVIAPPSGCEILLCGAVRRDPIELEHLLPQLPAILDFSRGREIRLFATEFPVEDGENTALIIVNALPNGESEEALTHMLLTEAYYSDVFYDTDGNKRDDVFEAMEHHKSNKSLIDAIMDEVDVAVREDRTSKESKTVHDRRYVLQSIWENENAIREAWERYLLSAAENKRAAEGKEGN